MSFSIDQLYSSMLNSTSASSSSLLNSTSSLSQLSSTTDLTNQIENAESDDDLMEACKSFEAYFLEQVFKGMQSTVDKAEDENEYTSMFNDMMIEQYAKNAVDAQGYGVAQMLYESMKNNQNSSVASATQAVAETETK